MIFNFECGVTLKKEWRHPLILSKIFPSLSHHRHSLLESCAGRYWAKSLLSCRLYLDHHSPKGSLGGGWGCPLRCPMMRLTNNRRTSAAPLHSPKYSISIYRMGGNSCEWWDFPLLEQIGKLSPNSLSLSWNKKHQTNQTADFYQLEPSGGTYLSCRCSLLMVGR